MTKQITAEEKARIFALYFNHKIMQRSHPSNIDADLYNVSPNTLTLWHLCVKPLSSITDNHASVVAEILGFHSELIKNGRAFVIEMENKKTMSMNFHPINVLEVIDFLRSRSYALPYRNYSVPYIVSQGVFKIVEP